MSEPEILTWIKRIQALGATGVHFAESEYDRERYVEMVSLSHRLLAVLGEVTVESIQTIFNDVGAGYATPKIDVRGAVIRDGKILLVKEKVDGLWTLPGGYADTGISAADNVVKEISEEAGLDVTADRLYAVLHKARHNYDVDARDFYKLFFLCSNPGQQSPRPGSETDGADFFAPDALPPLSTGRTIADNITDAFRYHDNPSMALRFD